jgi:hypothetical protein
MIRIPLSPKGTWPKDERKRVLRRAQLKKAGEFKKALNRRRYGTLGAASRVRHINPKDYVPSE